MTAEREREREREGMQTAGADVCAAGENTKERKRERKREGERPRAEW